MQSSFKMKDIIIVSFYLIIFLTVVFLITHQLESPGDYSSYASDIGSHICFVKPFFEGKIYIPHPIWHILVHYMNYITLNDKFSAALVTALLVILWIYIVQKIYEFIIGDKRKDIYLYYFLFITFIIGPAFIPFFSRYIIMGVGSPNLWNNVTLITVKPFAILTVFFTILGLERRRILYYFIGTISLLISIFAKPSFVIAFLPALILFIFFKKLYSKENIIYIAIITLLSIGALAYQFIHTYVEGNGKVIIDFLGIWSSVSPNVFISILLALLFPLLYFIVNFNNVKKNNYLLLIWLITFISIFYAAFFAESGPRYKHGNFFWSYMISLSLLYVFTFIDYFKHISNIKRHIKFLLNTVLLWQIIVGLYYFIGIVMRGGDPIGAISF